MAEVIDVIAGLLDGASRRVAQGGGGDDVRWRDMLVLVLLALGKIADIAADWFIVALFADDGVFAQRADFDVTRAVAITFAVLGSSIEVLAGVLKVRLYCVSHGASRVLKNLRLNRRLAWPRFLLDDLPATTLGIYLLVTPGRAAGAREEGETGEEEGEAAAATSELWLIAISCGYSLAAVFYHVCKSVSCSRSLDLWVVCFACRLASHACC